MKVHLRRRAASLLLAAALALSAWASVSPGRAASSVPAAVTPVTGVNVSQNDSAAVDYSNLAEGFVLVRYLGSGTSRLKVQITRSGGTTYTYNLNTDGYYETFPLTSGDGDYTVKVFQNTSGSKYILLHAATLTMTLRNQFLPFLYPNQYVNYTSSSQVVAKAKELVKGKTKTLDKVSAVYNYVVKNITYDKKKAATVQSGYLPNVDAILKSKTGICFDYAAVMAAMLRSQGVPCKLVVGYAGTAYHAWINVYVEGTGWVNNLIYFDGTSWKLMDPTFASSAKQSSSIMKYIGDGSNYTMKYAY